jgi:hypothetical protein
MRTLTRAFNLACAGGALLLLQACGGGSGGAATTTQIPSIDTGCLTAPAAVAITPAVVPHAIVGGVLVTGTALYASVPNNPQTGALNYAATVNKPIRGATVQAWSDANVLLASTTTSQTGTYALNVPANTMFQVRLLAELINTTGLAKWSVSVRDNTRQGGLWVLPDSLATSGSGPSVQRSITAGSGWGTESYTGARNAAPFAILDTIYQSMQFVTTAKANTLFPLLNVYWSPNNRSGSFSNPAIGEIPTSYFDVTGNCANPDRSIYVLGQDGVDTDEYDTSVVAHEYGHYLQSAFSTDHSTGGHHSSFQKLDMSLAFSEGWGNAWSSMVRGDPIYSDSSGSGQTGGFTISMAISPNDANRGWYREDSLETGLYALFVNQGFVPIWTALTGPMKVSQDALATIFSFAEAVRSAGNTAVNSTLNNLLFAQKIFTGATANQWGLGETNNGGSAANLPIYSTLTLGAESVSCFSPANLTPDASVNKLGAVKYFRVNLPGAGMRTVRSNFAQGGHDIDFEVFQKGVLRGAALSDSLTTETGTLYLAAGEAVIRLVDYNVASASTATSTCATIRID